MRPTSEQLARRASALPPLHPAGYERTCATARAALGEAAYAAAIATGRALALDRVLSDVLAADDAARRGERQ